jgi:transcriptional regulator with XRE-family HTH domain
LLRTGKTQEALGELLGVSHVAVHKWLTGAAKPSAERREAMRQAFGIEPEWWDHDGRAGAPGVAIEAARAELARRRPHPGRSRGAVLLARTGRTQAEIAEACGVSRALAGFWTAGTKRPGRDKRERLLVAFNIPPGAWDEPASAPVAARVTSAPHAPPASPSSAGWGGGEVLEQAAKLEAMAGKMLADLGADPSSSPLEKAKVLSSIASTLAVLAKITGDDLERRFLTLPIWRRIERVLEETLRDYPAAAAQMSESLERLRAEVEGRAAP